MAEGETAQTHSEWLGLGRLGWGLYVVVAFLNVYVVVGSADSTRDTVMYGVAMLIGAYLLIRFYKFLFGLLKRVL